MLWVGLTAQKVTICTVQVKVERPMIVPRLFSPRGFCKAYVVLVHKTILFSGWSFLLSFTDQGTF